MMQLPIPPADSQWAHCQEGHESHDEMLVNIDLADPKIKDMPRVNDYLAKQFRMYVWQWDDPTFTTYSNYCTQQDSVSWSIYNHGIWEPFETAIVLDILREPGAFLDIGAHIGWYSLLAAMAGCDVTAIEADPENIGLFEMSMSENGLKANIIHGYVDERVEPGPPSEVRLVKCDIEGAEPHAIEMISKALEAQTIDYLLIEISPAFAYQGRFNVELDTYPDLVERIADYGYDCYEVPHKGWAHEEQFINQPLLTLFDHAKIERQNLRSYVANKDFWQENFLFVKQGM